jgi:hypothetical protein
MTMFRLPETVVLPWYLRPVEQRTARELVWTNVPWSQPEWQNTWDGRPFVCPYDGAVLEVFIYADYSCGYECPEPAYAGYCPLCGTESEL